MIYFQAAFSPPTGVLRLDSLDSLSVDGKETYVLDDGYPDENDDGWDTDLEIDGTVEWYVAWTSIIVLRHFALTMQLFLARLLYVL